MRIFDQTEILNRCSTWPKAWIHDTIGERLFIDSESERQSNFADGVPELIEGISYHWRHEAHRILRLAIFSNSPISATAYTATRLCAKRVSFLATEFLNNSVAPECLERFAKNLKILEVQPVRAPEISLEKMRVVGVRSEANQAKRILEQLAAQAHSIASSAALLQAACEELQLSTSRACSGARQRVGALVMSTSGYIHAASFNLPDLCQTWHAEWLLLKTLKEEQDLILVSTRKPCRMCAALIFKHMQRGTIQQVHYLEFDPGPHARCTLLNAQSYDRLRFAPHVQGDLESKI